MGRSHLKFFKAHSKRVFFAIGSGEAKTAGFCDGRNDRKSLRRQRRTLNFYNFRGGSCKQPIFRLRNLAKVIKNHRKPEVALMVFTAFNGLPPINLYEVIDKRESYTVKNVF